MRYHICYELKAAYEAVTTNGRILIRCPPALHEQLAAAAQAQGVSLNQLAVALLAGAINFTLTSEPSAP